MEVNLFYKPKPHGTIRQILTKESVSSSGSARKTYVLPCLKKTQKRRMLDPPQSADLTVSHGTGLYGQSVGQRGISIRLTNIVTSFHYAMHSVMPGAEFR